MRIQTIGLTKASAGLLLAAFAGMLWSLVLTPGRASAAQMYTSGSTLVYRGDRDERNVVKAEVVNGVYLFTESGGPTIRVAPWPCRHVSAVQVACPPHGGDFRFITVDRDDHVDNSTSIPSDIQGGTGADVLLGGSGPDQIRGDGSYSTYYDEGDGRDTIDGRGGADFMAGDYQVDTVTYASRTGSGNSIRADLDSLRNDGAAGEGDHIRNDVENLIGSGGDDVLVGNHQANRLEGGPGGDELRGGDGGDVVSGDEGSDRLYGEGAGDDVLGGLDGDRLFGGEDGDVLRGAEGNDVLEGGTEGDSLFGGPDHDQVDYSGRTTPVDVKLDDYNTYGPNDGGAEDGAAASRDHVAGDVEELFGGAAGDTLTGDESDERLDGNGGPDVLRGTGGNDVLHGSGGDDDLDGGHGDDRLLGDNDNDRLEGGPHADAFHGGSGVDTADYRSHSSYNGQTGESYGVSVTLDDAANDGHLGDPAGALDEAWSNEGAGADNVASTVERVLGSEAPDVLTGNGLNNELRGHGGVDRLGGEGGDDSLDGGAGNDTLLGGSGNDSLAGASENDLLNTHSGQDIADGGDGNDTLTYENRRANEPVAVRLDGLRNDGSDANGDGISSLSEEGDRDIRIENATGTNGPDTLYAVIADTVVNVLRGRGGNDRLKTREGTSTTDQLVCSDGTDSYDADPSDQRSACENAIVLP